MADILDSVLADLAAESDQIEQWVSPVSEVDWTTVTTPEGWTVTHQIAHLAWTDQASLTAIAGGEAFDGVLNLALEDPLGFVDAETARWAAELPPTEQLVRWPHGRAALAAALRAVPAGPTLPW